MCEFYKHCLNFFGKEVHDQFFVRGQPADCFVGFHTLVDDPAKSQLNVILSKLECSSIHCPHPLIPSPGGRGVRSERPVCGSPSPAQSVGEGVRGVRECSN